MITTDANELVAEIHDRMPLILASGDYARWLGDSAPPLPIRLKPIRGCHRRRRSPVGAAVPMQRDVAGHAARIIRR
jgi:putative SOS response-associated peptidase YedK